MRVLYIDIDSLRPDHLGCYGYHRETSPNIDALAEKAVRFERCHVSDAPCLPSRTSLYAGQFGVHTGVINHGGVAAQPFIEGPGRGFRDRFGSNGWMASMRKAGYYTATISPFGERHSAWWWYAGFNEMHNTGGGGNDRADEVAPVALDWLDRRGKDDNWFLHLNVWDPHTPYRSPDEYIERFKDQPLPDWYTEDVRKEHWEGCGPHSAREVMGFDPQAMEGFRRKFKHQPDVIDSMDKARMMFDGYDAGVYMADEVVGMLIKKLEDLGVADDTAIIVSSDHGENLGELNIYGDHQTADLITTRVPMIIHWPGVTDDQQGRVDQSMLYANDMAATVIELVGGVVPGDWDGESFADAFKANQDGGREYLVVSQGAWSCQRAVRFSYDDRDYMCIRSYHDGYHGFPNVMLFDIAADPHEQNDLATTQPEIVERGLALLDDWTGRMRNTASHPHDPMWTVIQEGGAFHTRGELPAYLERLRTTGREQWADHLANQHPREAQG